ncbi:hypothetical protein [Paenarthrobacter aurescens]|uniref:hypothetical protein n=1 Tax=Paenarthrobacter aurescens TaxID=43663 RepID=UPI0021C18C1F|nr:hypothetical protein [Paenarthrobacter aurescens]MCT9869788.1 hypothetical protein [Paenarthrobacter aurescens]
MTVALREPGSTSLAEQAVDVATEQVLPMGPVHCGSHMAISAGPTYDSMKWVSVEPVWPEWACGCGFRMDIDAVDPVSAVWIAALRRQSLEHELAIAQNTLELAFNKAVDAGIEPQALAEVAGVPAIEVETLLRRH